MKKYLFILSIIPTLCSCTSNPLPTPEFNSTYNLHSEIQESFLTKRNFDSIGADGQKELSRPNPIELNYGDGLNKYEYVISENSDLSNPYTVSSRDKKIYLYNLKNETTYYVKCKKGKNESEVASFYNSTTFIRNIYIDGVTNVRDIGNKTTTNGKKIKQGLIYRGAALSGITSDGVKTLSKQLKIRTDIDLRTDNGEASDTNYLPNYINISMVYDSNIVNCYSKVKEVFDTFSDQTAYPIYFHCAIGTDRTGFIAYLLNGMLGVSKEDSLADYLFSNFGKIGSSRSVSNTTHYTSVINSLGKATHQENCISYLVEKCGITNSQIQTIQTLMTE